MSLFENFLHLNKQTPEQGGEESASPEQAPEKREQFPDCANTAEFRIRLAKGQFDSAEAWLEKVITNRPDYPQYNDSWVADRQREIAQYRELYAEGALEDFEMRPKEAAQGELIKEFGFGDTAGFRERLAAGDIDKAQAWLDYILDNSRNFPQYYLNKRWEGDRKRDLEEARKEKG